MTTDTPDDVVSSPLATSSPLVHGRKTVTAEPSVVPDTISAAPGVRRAGVLLHVTSLPGPDGIGDLGASSRAFVDWLALGGQRLWQTLPLNPPANDAMSPYDAASAFAGNALLISLDDLMELGLLPDSLPTIRASVQAGATQTDPMVAGRPGGEDPIERTARWKLPLVQQAARQLLSLPPRNELVREFLAFCERESAWLADHVAFTALREVYPGVPRAAWPLQDRIRRLGGHRTRAVAISATHQHPEAAVQFLFDRQLRALHEYARQRDVWIMGDVPIYVSDDSADVWAHPELFLLDHDYRPSACTGSPPDAANPAGQVWPMPAYDWDANAASGYEWWLQRLARALSHCDVLRIDHFRAFADWWSVPPRARYGEQGHWEPGPGSEFFDAVRARLGDVELVVEDLGPETEPLARLRRETGLPPMRVLVQGFDEGGASAHLPLGWTGTEAAYTDTHDFDTVAGWAHAAALAASQNPTDQRLDFALRFTGATNPAELPRAAIDTVMRSNARLAVVPLQDWLDMDSYARMNVPGTTSGNWRWVAPEGALTDELAAVMAASAASTSRQAAT